MVEHFENSGHQVFQGVSPLGRGILKKRINRETIHFNWEYGNINLLCRTVHAANQLCICGAVSKWCGPKSGEASQSRPESVHKMSPEIQIKQEDLKSLVDIPRLPHASGNRMLQNLKDFNSMPFMSKIEYLRAPAKVYHPIENGNYKVTTALDEGWRRRTSMCKEYTAPRNRAVSKPYASIDAGKEHGPVLNIEIATIIDVPGIEPQVPSLSSPRYSVWILISRGHERFVNEILRHNSDIVNFSSSLRAKEDNLNGACLESSKPAVVNHRQRSQDSNDVKTKVEPSSMHRETVASTIRVAPASSKSSSGSSSNPTSVHLKAKSIQVKKEIPKEERIWTRIPESPKCKRVHLRLASPVLKGKFRNQLEKEFTDEDWLHCLHHGSNETKFEICKDEDGELRYIRAIQRHSGGMIISPRLMNYVTIPYKWKRFLYHGGRARDQYSVAEIGLVARGKERKEGRQKIFFTPLDPFNSDAGDAESITDTTKPRKKVTFSNSLET